MFDRVSIVAKAGKGGDGAISMRREKFVPFGGPDGGDGGGGGDVILKADPSVESLLKFKSRRHLRASDGGNGGAQKRHGKKGDDLVITVPLGTLVWNNMAVAEDALLADLELAGQQVTVARGGKGGWGNTRFATATNQVPMIAQRGAEGEEIALMLEMRLIADVGIIGYPNAGKSTLLTAATAARPKIASYPFTTIEPVLGVVAAEQQSFVMAEIPGLIPGAHMGRGLGHDFLRHITRTKVLIHLLDGSGEFPVEDMAQVNQELNFFDTALIQKPQLVAVNKIDLPEVKESLLAIKKSFSEAGIKAYFVSAATGEGVAELMAAALRLLNQFAEEQEKSKKPTKVFRPRPREVVSQIHQEGNVFIIDNPELERLTTRDGKVTSELRGQLKMQLQRKRVGKALEKAGIKPGDKVRCGKLEWEW